MSRPVVLVILAIVLIAALVLFSTQAREVPTTVIETDVSRAPDAR